MSDRVPDQTEPSAGSTATMACSLPDGARLTVEVSGADAQTRAEKALAAAEAALARSAENREKGQSSDASREYAGIVGASDTMTSLFRLLERIQNSDATVLVLGENGTGKELVARAIHATSKRSERAFVATNCSAFNDNLLESELFGHRRGSFTGAVADKPGLFSVADRGTFFMDEVGDMSPALQVKLLRVLQEGVFMPVGGTETKRVDVRIIAATNRDLTQMVKDGKFREDLFYRLHVVSLRVPPLRERLDDIPLLVEHFLSRLALRDHREKTLTGRALKRLQSHSWPGNVRELENEVERAWVLSGDETIIDDEVLSASVRLGNGLRPQTPASTTTPQPAPLPATGTNLPAAVESLERRMISTQLAQHGGNKTRTAEALGISRRNLIRKVQSYGLDKAGRK